MAARSPPVLFADIDAMQGQRCQHRSRIRRFRLIGRTSRQPRVVQDVRVGVAPQNRQSCSHAGFRPSEWRDPDSNPGTPRFSVVRSGLAGGAQSLETKRFSADRGSKQKSAIYELLHAVQEMEASHLPFSLTPCQHDLGVGSRLAALAFTTRGLSLRAHFAKDARASRSRAGLSQLVRCERPSLVYGDARNQAEGASGRQARGQQRAGMACASDRGVAPFRASSGWSLVSDA